MEFESRVDRRDFLKLLGVTSFVALLPPLVIDLGEGHGEVVQEQEYLIEVTILDSDGNELSRKGITRNEIVRHPADEERWIITPAPWTPNSQCVIEGFGLCIKNRWEDIKTFDPIYMTADDTIEFTYYLRLEYVPPVKFSSSWIET